MFAADGLAVITNQYMKLAYFFLRYCCAWSNGTENVTGSNKSYIADDGGGELKNGTNGKINLTGTDWSFEDVDAANKFSNAVAGDFLCVVDSTNRINSSIFPINKVYSANKVDIDFKADMDNAEYPVQVASGLTWYLIPKGYELPSTYGDYWRLQSPHSTGWSLQMSYNATNRIGIQVAVDGSWSNGRYLGDGTGGNSGSFYINTYGSARSHAMDLIVESTGKLLFLGDWNCYTSTGQADNYQNLMVNEFDPVAGETTEDYEKIALIAPVSPSSVLPYRDGGSDKFGYFRSWNERLKKESAGYLLECTPRYNTGNSEDSPLPINPYRPIGTRDASDGQRVGKLVNYSGDVLATDVSVTGRDFRILGYTTEYRVCSPLHTGYGDDIRYTGKQHWRGPKTMKVTNAKDWLYHSNGFCFPWCEVTYKAFG
jgi:hypothetical protein